jgi:hypothetical protein
VSPTDPRAEYESRLRRWRERLTALDGRHLLLSNSRLAVAAVGAVLIWLAFFRASISAWWPVAAGLAFGALLVVHAGVLNRLERAHRAEAWYLRGLERLAGQWSGRGRGGARFAGDHPYARDLDLFGTGSLFELLNTATTEAGEDTLADWLRAGAPIAEVQARQQAVAELRSTIDFREDLTTLAAESEVSRTGSLAAWAQAAPAGLTPAAALAFAVCGIVTATLVVLIFAGWIELLWLIAWLFAEAAIASLWRARVRVALSRIGSADRDLALLAEVLARVEAETFASPRLTAIVSALLTSGVPPSRRIAQLRRLVGWLDSTRNQLFAPFALVLLLPQQLAVAIDRWHAAYGPHVVQWLSAIGELEALSALGTYAFERPRDPFPELTADGPRFEARALAHPLMADEVSVANDVALGGEAPHLLVISGSNMSGKSTLLRSIGVNTVLALAGGTVRAAELRLSPLVIGATLKVEDSLQAGHSRFYAEILRIRTIVDAARGPVPLVFLLDEILHGTNSYDRRIGAEAIVRALVSLGAIGLVTTHDLALTELPERLGSIAANRHFEDRLVDGRMVFDYTMRPGIVEHSNALALMRAIGLDV